MSLAPEDKEDIVKVIKETVNGKIDSLADAIKDHNEKHERDFESVRQHIEEVRPVLDAYKGGKVIGELIKWVAGVGAAVVLLWQWIAK